MTALSTILVNGNGTGPRNWNTQASTDIDDGIAGADGNEIVAASGTQNRNTSLDTSFLTAVLESDIGNVDTLSYDVRYRANNSTGDDTVTFGVRIMSGATVLAAFDSGGAFQTVLQALNSAWHTTLQNKGVTAFTFVNTTATQAQWDAAEIEFRSTHAANMSPDDNWVIVDDVELTGTYTIDAGVTVTPAELDLAFVLPAPTIKVAPTTLPAELDLAFVYPAAVPSIPATTLPAELDLAFTFPSSALTIAPTVLPLELDLAFVIPQAVTISGPIANPAELDLAFTIPTTGPTLAHDGHLDWTSAQGGRLAQPSSGVETTINWKPVTSYEVRLDINIDTPPVGRIVVGVHGDSASTSSFWAATDNTTATTLDFNVRTGIGNNVLSTTSFWESGRHQYRFTHSGTTVTAYKRDPATFDVNLSNDDNWTQADQNVSAPAIADMNDPDTGALVITRRLAEGGLDSDQELHEYRLYVDGELESSFMAGNVTLNLGADTFTDDQGNSWSWATAADPTQTGDDKLQIHAGANISPAELDLAFVVPTPAIQIGGGVIVLPAELDLAFTFPASSLAIAPTVLPVELDLAFVFPSSILHVAPTLLLAELDLAFVFPASSLHVAPTATPAELDLAFVSPQAIASISALRTPAELDLAFVFPGPVLTIAPTVTPPELDLAFVIPTPTLLVPPVVTPAELDLAFVFPQALPRAGALVTPAELDLAFIFPQAIASVSALRSPAELDLAFVIPTPTLLAGALVTPAELDLAFTVQAVTIAVGPVVIPAGLNLVFAFPVPSLAVAPTTTPAELDLAFTFPAPIIRAGSLITPAGLDLAFTFPASSIHVAPTVTPATIPMVVTFPALSLHVAPTVAPAVLDLAFIFPQATPIGGSRVLPATLVSAFTIPIPTISAGATVTPASLVLLFTFPTSKAGVFALGALILPLTADLTGGFHLSSADLANAILRSTADTNTGRSRAVTADDGFRFATTL